MEKRRCEAVVGAELDGFCVKKTAPLESRFPLDTAVQPEQRGTRLRLTCSFNVAASFVPSGTKLVSNQFKKF